MSENEENLPRVTLLRRLAAILYDGVLVTGIVLLAATIPTMLFNTNVDGDYTPFYEGSPFLRGLFFIYLIVAAFSFYGWFWLHGGQTLGMKTWHIRIRSLRPGPVTPWQTLLRFLMAIGSWLPLGLGFLWQLWDRDKLTWHDRFSFTELVVTPKKK